MSDLEMLEECLQAFRALDTADHANKFLKSRGLQHVAYNGSGQNKLRAWMLKQLEEHLQVAAN